MADIRPFRAVRPRKDIASQTAALPYDVYSREEALDAVRGKPLSFLNIDRPETLFEPGHDMYAPEVYEAAKKLYDREKAEGVYLQDETPCFYIYELTMNGRHQTGIAAISAVDDYLDGICRKHENTVEAKELDRIRHVDALSAQTGPIFLAFRDDDLLNTHVIEWKAAHDPVYDFVSEDGVGHRVWVMDDDEATAFVRNRFLSLPATYIADGHHRAASAVKVALKRRAEDAGIKAGSEYHTDPAGFREYNYFLSVLFPASELKIMDYNRVVRDLNGLSTADFLGALSGVYDVEPAAERGDTNVDPEIMRPGKKYDTGMYLDGAYYMLRLKDEIADRFGSDPVRSLDVSVLQDHVLSALLGIGDPRTDGRIIFVGGIKGIKELKNLADRLTAEGTGRGPAVAFAMYPTSIDELFAVADAGQLMPPKSTWFEPKLRSGLLIHEF